MGSSHYQSYLKAIGGQDKGRSVSTPVSSTSPIHRKSVNRSVSPAISSPAQNHNGPTTPSSTQPRSNISITPVSTAPSSVANYGAAPATPLASHPPDRADPVPAKPSSLEPLTPSQITAAFTSLLTLLHSAIQEHNKGPFAAILLGPDSTTQLLSHLSISATRRAETELARLAADQYSPAYLRKCTLVTAWEPCPMSAGTIYLSGIGRVVYAASEGRLRELALLPSEATLSVPCRTIFNAGSREIEVIGPLPEWEDKVVQAAMQHQNGDESVGKAASIRSNGTGSGAGEKERMSVVTTWTHEDSVLSSIGEDGEYKADLDIDWMK
ncbi:uncharacterized protein AB675_7784 [Cyphellophora attinorum]|uniref:CMP/dCMP-type deaminase domain-containing protein n=1 Tax=Cyphellophora attinorum TaxID=1664694 RepID=A0A0N1H511_9EURO|nr:uncharacterized protein AB675_7784 [Phialophora attinorum]KPI40584.1 hypothetical protein AB675_7784 [Phialophora attinorum]